jgi:hypothetical protein
MTDLEVARSQVPSVRDVGAFVHSTAQRALEILAESETVEEVETIRKQWEAFVMLADVKRRRSNAQAAAVSRMIELKLGELLEREEIPDGMTSYEVTIFRLMYRYRDITEDVIAHATNAAPASRNRVLMAIRWHRSSVGELKRTAPIKKRPSRPKHITDQIWDNKEAPGQIDTTQQRDGDISVVYQRIRQAQSTLAGCHSGFKTEILAGILVNAEALAVEIIRDARCER